MEVEGRGRSVEEGKSTGTRRKTQGSVHEKGREENVQEDEVEIGEEGN